MINYQLVVWLMYAYGFSSVRLSNGTANIVCDTYNATYFILLTLDKHQMLVHVSLDLCVAYLPKDIRLMVEILYPSLQIGISMTMLLEQSKLY